MVFGTSPGLTQSSVVPQEATDNDGAQTARPLAHQNSLRTQGARSEERQNKFC